MADGTSPRAAAGRFVFALASVLVGVLGGACGDDEASEDPAAESGSDVAKSGAGAAAAAEPAREPAEPPKSSESGPKTEAAPPEPEPEPAPEPEPGPVVGPEVGSAAEQELIDAAVRARRIRVLDIMLVDGRRSKRTRYDLAEKWCAGRYIEGVGGWRLPSVGEVSSLTLNGVVSRDNYWSQTKGDTFGDRMLMWSGKRKRIQPTSKRYRGARAVCVRTRDGRPPDDNEMEVQVDD